MKKIFWHNVGRSFHIWGQVEAVFNISKFSKWPTFWARDELFYRKLYRKWNRPDSYPLIFPTFRALDRRSSSNSDGDISLSKFDLLCDLMTSSMTSWICVYVNVVKISWYLCTGSLMMISEVKLKLCLIFQNFQNGRHFELATNFLPEDIPEVENTRNIAISISDILSFWSTL